MASKIDERGLGVDAHGSSPGDPTANVLALVREAIGRQDDLRNETNRRIDTELKCVREVSDLKAAHVKEVGEMRATQSAAMAVAESKRLDAVRAIDVLNASTAAERSQVATQVLATKTATDAENIRAALTATATTIAQQSALNLGAITERIAALEKSSYEGAGKSKVVDPQMADLIGEMKKVLTAQGQSAGVTAGLDKGWAILIGAVGLIGTLIGVVAYLK